MRKEILRMDHIICMDNHIPVLNHLGMQVFTGEIYGVLCLEHHGIEQMVELICWNRPIQYGQVFFEENLVNSMEKSISGRNRVALIGRESRLIDDLSLADNLFVIRRGFRKFVIPRRILQEQTQRMLDELNIQISPAALIQELGAFERLVAEVLQAMVGQDHLIILFDISDMLSSEELPRFHRLIRKLTQEGYTFLYIYNHHEVLKSICDRIGIFKAGRIEKVIANPTAITDAIRIFARYPYEKMATFEPDDNNAFAQMPPVLQLEEVQAEYIRNLSFSVHPGENVLLWDQSNTILDEFMELLGKERKPVSGSLRLPDAEAGGGRRIAFIQRNPVRSTLFWEMSFLDNLCFPLADKVPFFWQKRYLRESVTKEFRGELGDLLDEPELYNLNSKELYTLVYYRYLIAKPSLVVCLQPLSGADMYLRTHILSLMAKLRRHGIAVLVLNTELYDTLYIADRLIQVEQGKVVAEHPRCRFDEVKIEKKDIFPD